MERSESIAKRLGVSGSTVRSLARRGELPHVRLGPRMVLFDWERVREHLENQMRRRLPEQAA
jgi:excisionase family DNA binding protein